MRLGSIYQEKLNDLFCKAWPSGIGFDLTTKIKMTYFTRLDPMGLGSF